MCVLRLKFVEPTLLYYGFKSLSLVNFVVWRLSLSLAVCCHIVTVIPRVQGNPVLRCYVHMLPLQVAVLAMARCVPGFGLHFIVLSSASPPLFSHTGGVVAC